MLGYKKEYGYFLRKLTPPGDPEFLFDGIIAENELVTNVVALTTYNESESFSGVLASLTVETLVE